MPPHEKDIEEERLCCKELLITIENLKAELLRVQRISESKFTTAIKVRCPLENVSILSDIFAYVGKFHWVYVAGVSRHWRGLYMRFSPLRTSLRNTVTSLSRIKHAFHCGINMADPYRRFCWIAKKYGNDEVIAWAALNGMPRILKIA